MSEPLILHFFDAIQPFEFMGTKRYSTLVAGLRDCRIYSKRDIVTGRHNPSSTVGDEGNWLATIGYFTVLDQIGSCYKPKGILEPETNTNSIKFAIEQFAYDLLANDPRKLSALIALRNAFTHDFNLLNIPRNPNLVALEQHKFTVMVDLNETWVIKLPSQQWDGNIEDKNFLEVNDTTFVNLFGFGSLVESVYSRIYELAKNDEIDLQIPLVRLLNKYTFVTSEHPIKA